MRKVVINSCYGGFSLSGEAIAQYAKLVGVEAEDVYDRDIPRDDARLVCVVEELGERANGEYALLRIVEIPEDVRWEVEEYDGSEWIAEVHRVWR